mgnify:CR=1 FL=1
MILKDILILKIISAKPDFKHSNRYDAFHHIKIIKFDELNTRFILNERNINTYLKTKYIIEGLRE